MATSGWVRVWKRAMSRWVRVPTKLPIPPPALSPEPLPAAASPPLLARTPLPNPRPRHFPSPRTTLCPLRPALHTRSGHSAHAALARPCPLPKPPRASPTCAPLPVSARPAALATSPRRHLCPAPSTRARQSPVRRHCRPVLHPPAPLRSPVSARLSRSAFTAQPHPAPFASVVLLLLEAVPAAAAHRSARGPLALGHRVYLLHLRRTLLRRPSYSHRPQRRALPSPLRIYLYSASCLLYAQRHAVATARPPHETNTRAHHASATAQFCTSPPRTASASSPPTPLHPHPRLSRCLRIVESLRIFESLALNSNTLEHYEPSIRLFGSADGFDTESPERPSLHIHYAKNTYRASNRKDYIVQMTLWLERQESVAQFSAFKEWMSTPHSSAAPTHHPAVIPSVPLASKSDDTDTLTHRTYSISK
ncbi:hypothetical protein B0H14DRAFT_3523482 [Mycena olivaceomarginata]|nr:hypothetical protein B0H14DRAFT_3523482 [Mycena olivaceomarginata]